MTKDARPASLNEYDERALWLRAAADALRPDFELSGLPLPTNVRFGFSTKGKGTQQTGECWHSPASADGAFEIFIRADQGNPLEILGILCRYLVHAALPAEESHGKRFRAAATRIGLVGKMRNAVPGHLLEPRLQRLLDELGPLPHAPLDISWKPFEQKKRQPNKYLSATCEAADEHNGVPITCGYQFRITAKWAKFGAHCPVHGPMPIEHPSSGDDEAKSMNGSHARSSSLSDAASAG